MKRFPAKLLLFGEYVLLLGAPALAMPVAAFSGHWRKSADRPCPHPIDPDFVRSEALARAGVCRAKLEADLQSGLCFESTIPTGYGLGSSGALCAAIYSRYVRKKETDPTLLKDIFAGMESWFHGQSSGLDPLTSYLNCPLRITRQAGVQIFEGAAWKQDEAPMVFLLDSGVPRQTGTLVRWFLDAQKTADFGGMLRQEYLPAHTQLMDAWGQADPAAFWPALHTISRLQIAHYTPMIPAGLRDFWTANLQNPDVAFKICGAGGGGFLLGFARTRAAATAVAPEIIFPFDKPDTHAKRRG
ncbi:MAG: mevalonate kinase family protein [Saprospiraceae bacterium]